jgi:hypothetical protein
MKFCQFCGVALDGSWAFCQSCGRQIAISARATGTTGASVVSLPSAETLPTERLDRPTHLEPVASPNPLASTPRYPWKLALIGLAIVVGLALTTIAAMNDIGTHHHLGATRAQLALANASNQTQAARLKATQANLTSTQDLLTTTSKSLHSAKGKIRVLQQRLSSANQAAAKANAAASAARTTAATYQGAAQIAFTSGYRAGYNDGWWGFPYLP